MSTLREAQPPAAPTAATTSTTRDRLVVFSALTSDLHFPPPDRRRPVSGLTGSRRVEVPYDFCRVTATAGPQPAKNPWEYSDGRVGQPIRRSPDGSTLECAACQTGSVALGGAARWMNASYRLSENRGIHVSNRSRTDADGGTGRV